MALFRVAGVEAGRLTRNIGIGCAAEPLYRASLAADCRDGNATRQRSNCSTGALEKSSESGQTSTWPLATLGLRARMGCPWFFAWARFRCLGLLASLPAFWWW